jgi:hypothetical protein
MTTKIYHYTNAEGLFGILSPQRKIWASCSTFMNDPKELIYCKKLFIDRIEYYESNNPHLKDDINELKQWVIGVADAHYNFILSFSMNPDSLSLWNRYGHHDGYNIEFNHEMFYQHVITLNGLKFFGAGPVIYDLKQQISKVDELINKYITEYAKIQHKPIDNEITANIKNSILPSLFFYKDINFRDEYEFRYLFKLIKSTQQIHSDQFKNNVHFRVRNGVITPYIEIPLDDKINFIKKIYIGPLNNSENSIEGLKLFFEKYRLKIDIDISNIPYRNV